MFTFISTVYKIRTTKISCGDELKVDVLLHLRDLSRDQYNLESSRTRFLFLFL